MTTHPNCPNNKSLIHRGKLYTGCEQCLYSQTVREAPGVAQGRRSQQAIDYRKDAVQRVQPREYAKAYPAQFRERYGDAAYRKWSS